VARTVGAPDPVDEAGDGEVPGRDAREREDREPVPALPPAGTENRPRAATDGSEPLAVIVSRAMFPRVPAGTAGDNPPAARVLPVSAVAAALDGAPLSS